MKQLYFAVPYARNIKFSVVNDDDDEIGNFHLAFHETEFGEEGIVTLLENGNVIDTRIINTGMDNELDFGPIISEVDESIMNVVVVVEANGHIIVSVK